MTDLGAPGELNPGADLAALRAEIDLLRAKIEAVDPGPRSGPEARPTAFMIMPFGPDDLQIVYEDFIKPVVESKCGFECVRGDDMFGSNVVMADVLAAIQKARVVIADLTERNPNVFYEVGIAHALDVPVLLISQSLDDIPFDLRHRRVLIYDYTPRGCKTLETKIEQHLLQMFGN
ncbi:hypothetical protein AB0K00_05085 [Dactylosporangium sp. NPDC049525]|uniref:hypothetical protein n=1 Tax=Dactylosporangium sp. NPDC049525 TaxID=3154730 RepID=UPI0034481011